MVVEVSFYSNTIQVNNHTIYIVGGYEGSICVSVEDCGFYSIEEAVKWCLEN